MCLQITMLIICIFDVLIESVQQSLEKKFGKTGGSIPITPSDLFEKRMGVSTDTITYLFLIHCYYTASQKWGTHIVSHSSHKNRAL